MVGDNSTRVFERRLPIRAKIFLVVDIYFNMARPNDTREKRSDITDDNARESDYPFLKRTLLIWSRLTKRRHYG